MSRRREPHHTDYPLAKAHPMLEAHIQREGWVLQVWDRVLGAGDKVPVLDWIDVVFDGVRFKKPDGLGLDTFPVVGDSVMAGRLLRFFAWRHPADRFRVVHTIDVRTSTLVMEPVPTPRAAR